MVADSPRNPRSWPESQTSRSATSATPSFTLTRVLAERKRARSQALSAWNGPSPSTSGRWSSYCALLSR
jgi:hypothetical protein